VISVNQFGNRILIPGPAIRMASAFRSRKVKPYRPFPLTIDLIPVTADSSKLQTSWILKSGHLRVYRSPEFDNTTSNFQQQAVNVTQQGNPPPDGVSMWGGYYFNPSVRHELSTYLDL
jgi:hypothetical protein